MSSITNITTKAVSKTGAMFKKHGPEILVIAGIAGTVVTTVFACKATTKIDDILDESKKDVEKVHAMINDESISEETYSEKDSKKDLAIIYTKTGVKLAKLYAPAVITGVVSISCLLTSNHILKKRNAALVAAYTAIDKGFKEYRNRVIDKFGEEIDKELRYGIKAKKISETIVDEETGKEKKVKTPINVVDELGEYSIYARFFDDASTRWEKNPEMNLMLLRQTQDWFNRKLKDRGFIFLNEVYEELGLPLSEAGQIVGWYYNEDAPNGDNYIDFGIYNMHRQASRDFVNGYEPVILLDFNVDGPITHLL